MFRWHSTRLRIFSALFCDDKAINFRSSLSNFRRKLAFRTITSDVSRSYKPSGLEPPLLSLEHDIYISTSTDPFFNLTLEDWYGSFLGLDYIDQANPALKRTIQYLCFLMDGDRGVFFLLPFNCDHMTGYSDIPPHHLHSYWYIAILPVSSLVEIKIRGQRSISLHSVQLVSLSFVEGVGEELFIT